MEELIRNLVERNRESRDAAANRIQRLTNVMQTGTIDEYNAAVRDILDPPVDGEGDRVLGEDGPVEFVDGGARSRAPTS